MELNLGKSVLNVKHNPGTGFAVGGALAILFTTAATAIYPSYSERSQAISYLGGAGVPTEIFWDMSTIIVGILWIWGTHRLFYRSGLKFRPAIFYLAGIGFLLVGSSPWNQFPLTHYTGAQFIFIFGAASCILGYRMTKGPFSGISLIAGLFSILSYLSGYFGGDFLLGTGGMERMIFYPILLWQILFGGYLMSQHQISIHKSTIYNPA